MKLYWCERTRAVRAAWMMEELGVPYELVRIDIRNEHSRADPSFRAASPMGKVPALEDGAVRLWDSGAICAYIADQYPREARAIDRKPDRGAISLDDVQEFGDRARDGREIRWVEAQPVTYGWGGWGDARHVAYGCEHRPVDSG